jgi:hypothetical protein
MVERSQALKNYGNLVGRVWENEQLFEQLKAEPKKVLKDFGFNIPEDAKVNLIIRELNTQGNPDTQLDMFAKGEETGVYDIIIPTKPAELDPSELPLQEEVLELMAGGMEAALAGCCPCSTCCCPCCGDSAV